MTLDQISGAEVQIGTCDNTTLSLNNLSIIERDLYTISWDIDHSKVSVTSSHLGKSSRMSFVSNLSGVTPLLEISFAAHLRLGVLKCCAFYFWRLLVVVLKQLLAFMTCPILGDIFHTERRQRNREKCMATSSPTFSFLYLSPFETDSFHDCLNICQHKICLIICLLSICSTNDSSKCRQKLEKIKFWKVQGLQPKFFVTCKICNSHLSSCKCLWC